MSDQDAKWAERVRRREALHAEMERQREACRQEHIAVVEAALRSMPSAWSRENRGHYPEDCAAVAIDALIAHGVCLGVRIGGGEDMRTESTE